MGSEILGGSGAPGPGESNLNYSEHAGGNKHLHRTASAFTKALGDRELHGSGHSVGN